MNKVFELEYEIDGQVKTQYFGSIRDARHGIYTMVPDNTSWTIYEVEPKYKRVKTIDASKDKK